MTNFDVIYAHETYFKGEEQKESKTPRTIGDWRSNLTREDIDLIDKIENLSEGDMIDNTIYEELKINDSFFREVEESIISLLSDKSSSVAWYYLDAIENNATELYDMRLTEDMYDYSSGLYNCDELYVSIIQSVYKRFLVKGEGV